MSTMPRKAATLPKGTPRAAAPGPPAAMLLTLIEWTGPAVYRGPCGNARCATGQLLPGQTVSRTIDGTYTHVGCSLSHRGAAVTGPRYVDTATLPDRILATLFPGYFRPTLTRPPTQRDHALASGSRR